MPLTDDSIHHRQGGGTEPYASAIPEIPSALGALDAAGRAEFWAALALYHTRGLGGRTCGRLLKTFGSAYEAVHQVDAWASARVNEEKRRIFRTEEWRLRARHEWDATRGLEGTVLLWTDPRYPAQLRELPDAPVRLYCQGDISLLSNPCIGIVGTRKCSQYGLRAATGVAAGLAAAGVTVVSGLAIGIDRQAHLASLELPGRTIAVLGTGLDVEYPRLNQDVRRKIAQWGLLLTEYAPGVHADPSHFPVRNRIISGLSMGVLVVEAARRSGSLITARLALEQNRTVYAIPGQYDAKESRGCQELIRQGAQPVFSAADILTDLFPQLRTSVCTPAPALTSEILIPEPQKNNPPPQHVDDNVSLPSRILRELAQGQPLRIDDVCHRLDALPGEVSAQLTILEIQSMIRSRADGTYSLA